MPKTGDRPSDSIRSGLAWTRLVAAVDKSLARDLGVARGKEAPRLQVDSRLRLRGVRNSD
jgi:hypothetical protein